jgi:DNA-binding GntR family transcriptional regulator
MSNPPQFKHRNLPDSLADHIVTMIATGQLAAGQRLWEKEICEQLGVSRIPVREALRILQAQGVVRTEPNRGTFVAEFGSREMDEMLEVRSVVEKLAVRRLLLLSQENPGIFDAFDVHIHNMRQAAMLSDRLAYCKADLGFHNCLIELCASPMLKPIWDSLSRDVVVFLMQERDAGYDFNRSVREHESLLRTFRTGNVEQIEQELQQHIWGSTRGTSTGDRKSNQRATSPGATAKPRARKSR